ncbi:MAG: NAD-dependent epimerase/dehydratase family protein [Clostridiales bacterium]|nr:NAD-dependent epimerase/dehydratase family protein [Clostridiales bacterium]
MRVLITGGAGFIGSHLSEALLARGDHVLALDSFTDYYDPALKRRNVAEVAAVSGGRYRLVEADLRDAAALDAAIADFEPDAAMHLAACAGVRPSIENPALYYDVNVMGTLNLLNAMARRGVKRLAFASSSSVYGDNEKVPFSEDDRVDFPISPYAATKKAGELMIHTEHALHGLSAACLRFFTVYGPRQRPDLAISKFARLIAAGAPIPVYGDGGTSRDYTYVSDIVSGIVAAIDWTAGPAKYDIFNLGGSSPVTLGDMVACVASAVGRPAIVDRQAAQPGDVRRTFADTRKAAALLGYAPAVPFAEGVARYVAWAAGCGDIRA